MTVDEAIIKQETLDFLQVAEKYCVFVETETTTGIEYYLKARKILTTLYAAAIRLPEISITSDAEFDNRITDAQQQSIVKRLADNIGEKRFYWDTFDPTNEKETEPVCHDLVDDLADVYRDIKSCITIYNMGTSETREHALWELRFSFDSHWGRHNINALRALHYLTTND